MSIKHVSAKENLAILKENTTLKKVKKERIKLEKDLSGLRRPIRYKFFESLILAQD